MWIRIKSMKLTTPSMTIRLYTTRYRKTIDITAWTKAIRERGANAKSKAVRTSFRIKVG